MSASSASNAPFMASTPNVDFDVLRAQLVNCLHLACDLLGQHNPGLAAHCLLSRFMGLGVLFSLQSPQFEARRYILKLTTPDGTKAHFTRLDAQGDAVGMDEVDDAYMNAIGHCLEDTVHAAWKQMVPAEPSITHLPPTTLQ